MAITHYDANEHAETIARGRTVFVEIPANVLVAARRGLSDPEPIDWFGVRAATTREEPGRADRVRPERPEDV